jgi:predicted RNA-binding Zn-ribbon protein involved in translation (DUF1610 family)
MKVAFRQIRKVSVLWAKTCAYCGDQFISRPRVIYCPKCSKTIERWKQKCREAGVA